MTTTKLSLYNGANRLLGERKTTLTEDRASRRYLDDAWDDGVVDGCLEQGYWSFAVRSTEATADASITPPFGYRYAFRKPDDYIKISAICSDEFFQHTISRYCDEGDYFYTDIDVIYLQYVSNDSAYGNDMSRWPQSFQKFVQASLADEVKELVTGNDGKYDRIKKALKDAKTDARSKDLMNKPVKYAPAGSWVSARMQSRVNTDSNRS
jgi:hypothetical protein